MIGDCGYHDGIVIAESALSINSAYFDTEIVLHFLKSESQCKF